MNCDECGGPTFFDPRRSETICTQCSLVVQPTVFDLSPPPNYEENQSPRAEASTLNTGVLATRFTNERYDGRGNVINDETRSKMRRLSWVNTHAVRKKDRSTKRLYTVTSNACGKLGFPYALRDRAFYLVKQAYEKNVLSGQEFALLVGGVLMVTAREANRYMSMDELVAALSISRKNPEKQLRSAYRAAKRALGMQAVRNTAAMVLSKVDGNCPRCTSTISHALRAEAIEIVKLLQPPTKAEVDAATALFVAGRRLNLPLSQVCAAAICGTNDVSIRGRLWKFFPEYVSRRSKRSNTPEA